MAFEVDHRVDDLVQGVLAIEVIDVYTFSILADSMGTVLCLGHNSRGPVGFCENHC